MFYFFVNCNQVCSSLKYILKFTIFCIVKNPLSLCVFIPNGFPYIFFHRKKSITVSCYILYFWNTILIFRLFFLFHCIYLSYTFNTDTWREQKMISRLACSRRNRDVNKQRWLFRICVTLNINIYPELSVLTGESVRTDNSG